MKPCAERILFICLIKYLSLNFCTDLSSKYDECGQRGSTSKQKQIHLATLSRSVFLPIFCPLPELISNCSLRGCQENCGITPAGSACYCKSGYEIGPDGKACKGEVSLNLVDGGMFLFVCIWGQFVTWNFIELDVTYV